MAAAISAPSAAAMGQAPAEAAGAAGPAAVKSREVVLYEDARARMEAGRYDEAAALLEESIRIKPGLGRRFYLSECYERLGRTASAWSGYNEVARAAAAQNRSPEAAAAEQRAAALEPKLSRLRIRVASPADAALEVTRTAKALKTRTIVESDSYGRDVPVDPDTYTVRASAPGKTAWSGEVIVAKPGETAEIVIPPLGDAAGPSRSKTAAISLGVLSALALGSGVASTVAWKSAALDEESLRNAILGANGWCWTGGKAAPDSRCGELHRIATKGDTMQGVALGSFITGGIALGGMVTYLVVSGRASPQGRSSAAIHVAPTASREGAGLVAVGAF